MDKPYVAIFCIVNHGFTDLVMESAKSAGARGGTVLTARGSGNREAEEFFMILVPEEIRDKVMSAVNAGAGMNTKGMGIAFALPVSDIVGIDTGEATPKETKEGEDKPA